MMKNRLFIAGLLLTVVATNYCVVPRYSCAEIEQKHVQIQQDFLDQSSAAIAAKTKAGTPISGDFERLLREDEIIQKAIQAHENGVDLTGMSATGLKNNVADDCDAKGKDLDRQAAAYAYRERIAQVFLAAGAVCIVGGIVTVNRSGSRGAAKLGVAGAFVGGVGSVGGGIGWYLYNSEAQSNVKEHRIQVTKIDALWKDGFVLYQAKK
jgi:hypothetical protein